MFYEERMITNVFTGKGERRPGGGMWNGANAPQIAQRWGKNVRVRRFSAIHSPAGGAAPMSCSRRDNGGVVPRPTLCRDLCWQFSPDGGGRGPARKKTGGITIVSAQCGDLLQQQFFRLIEQCRVSLSGQGLARFFTQEIVNSFTVSA